MAKLWNDEDTFTVTEAGQMLRKSSEAIKRVRELHKPFTRKVSALWSNAGELETLCLHCEVQSDSAPYPCPTIKALDFDLDYVEVNGETDGTL